MSSIIEIVHSLGVEQNGRVHRRQILSAGGSPDWIDRRLSDGWLRPAGRGVYAVGVPHTGPLARVRGHQLAAGPESAVTGRTVASIHDFLPWIQRTELLVPSKHVIPGARCHRSHTVEPTDIALIDGLRIVTIPRMFLDLAAYEPEFVLRKAWRNADARNALPIAAIRDRIGRARGARGVARVRTLADMHVAAYTRSGLEQDFVTLVEAAGLPHPEYNVIVPIPGHERERDAVWWEARLIVEIDGRDPHSSLQAFEEDRAFDNAAQLHGWMVLRYTRVVLRERPTRIVSEIRRTLTARGLLAA